VATKETCLQLLNCSTEGANEKFPVWDVFQKNSPDLGLMDLDETMLDNSG
jgi:predicted secreted acid phosphatase